MTAGTVEPPIKSLAKSITWRMTATTTTVVIVFLLTGQLLLALEVGLLEMVAKLVIYYLHERGWALVGWGSGRGLGTAAESGLPPLGSEEAGVP